MNEPTEIKSLFVKFIKKECSPDEVQQLLTYIKNSKNLSEVPSIEEVYRMLDEYPDMTERQADNMFSNILEAAEPVKRKYHLWKYAAAIAVMTLVSAYFLRNNFVISSFEAAPVVVGNNIQIGTDKATLTLENGDEIQLIKEKKYLADHMSSNGEELVYKAGNASKEMIYNYLTVPRGGQFQLQLADGTKVWLNSETKLKYPVSFLQDEIRKVELLYGEAYFEVSPSTKHHGAGFNVKTQSQEVEVLGTQFNIKAYEGTANIYTTLVEGKVAINIKDKRQNLIPDQQAVLSLDNDRLVIRAIDVYDEVSWKSGLFSFKRKPLKEIMTVLSRWYDIDVEFENESLEKVKFNGVLLRNQSIDEILSIIRETKFIKDYDIKNKKVILR